MKRETLRKKLTARTSGPGPELSVRTGTSGQPSEVKAETRAGDPGVVETSGLNDRNFRSANSLRKGPTTRALLSPLCQLVSCPS